MAAPVDWDGVYFVEPRVVDAKLRRYHLCNEILRGTYRWRNGRYGRRKKSRGGRMEQMEEGEVPVFSHVR